MTQHRHSFWVGHIGRVHAAIVAQQGHSNVLDTRVIVEAAHRSAQADGQRNGVSRHDDLGEYRALCVANGLMKKSLR